jgi:hypothetical protein
MPSHSAHKARLHQARIISVLDNFEPRLDLLTAHRAVMGGCGASEARLEASTRNEGSVRICIQAYYACFGIASWLRSRSLRCFGLKIDWRRVCLRASFSHG